MPVLEFRAPPRWQRNKAKLANMLGELAEHVRRGECENEPHGAVVILISDAGFEVLNVGVTRPEAKDASDAAWRKFR